MKRPFLKLSEAKPGQVVELDEGFTCHSSGKVTLQVYNGNLLPHNKGHLYFVCDEGNHFISGQADENGFCIGIYGDLE